MTFFEVLQKLNEYESGFSVGNGRIRIEDGERLVLDIYAPNGYGFDEYELAVVEHRLVKLARKWGLIYVVNHNTPMKYVFLHLRGGSTEVIYFTSGHVGQDQKYDSTAQALAEMLLSYKRWEAVRNVETHEEKQALEKKEG
jgi:hypothetical protein